MPRLMRKDEIEKTAKIMAECFWDYPLYDVFFPQDEKRKLRVFYFFWYRMYTRRSISYVSDDLDVVASIQHPGDKLISPLGLLLNPRFLFGFLKNIPLSSLKLVREYGKMEEELLQKYYDPKTDSFCHTICVLKKSRGTGSFFRFVKALDDGSPMCCETHTARNVRLYTHMGCEVCEAVEWHGVTHTVLKRPRQEPKPADVPAEEAVS